MKKLYTYHMRALLLAVGGWVLCLANADAQGLKSGTFGNGLKIMSKDSTMSMRISTRIQNRYDFHHDIVSGTTEDRFVVRRARLKFDGYAFSPKLKYKIEADIVSGQMLDAVGMWNFAGNFELWFGQTKLPSNRDRVISSQNMQFIDRSQLNSGFTLDRDAGFQLRHDFTIGKMVVREILAVSQGEGPNFTAMGDGKDFVGRVELLPFGLFEDKGDYVGSAMVREQTPKLAIGVTYDYNDNAMRERGQLGNTLSATKDLTSLQADFMFKYRGISIMGEFANRKAANNDPVNFDATGIAVDSYYTGYGINAQIGFMTKTNWEFAFRQTQIYPEAITGNPDLQEITFAISKFISGHDLKVQSDFGYLTNSSGSEDFVARLQMEISF